MPYRVQLREPVLRRRNRLQLDGRLEPDQRAHFLPADRRRSRNRQAGRGSRRGGGRNLSRRRVLPVRRRPRPQHPPPHLSRRRPPLRADRPSGGAGRRSDRQSAAWPSRSGLPGRFGLSAHEPGRRRVRARRDLRTPDLLRRHDPRTLPQPKHRVGLDAAGRDRFLRHRDRTVRLRGQISRPHDRFLVCPRIHRRRSLGDGRPPSLPGPLGRRSARGALRRAAVRARPRTRAQRQARRRSAAEDRRRRARARRAAGVPRSLRRRPLPRADRAALRARRQPARPRRSSSG